MIIVMRLGQDGLLFDFYEQTEYNVAKMFKRQLGNVK